MDVVDEEDQYEETEANGESANPSQMTEDNGDIDAAAGADGMAKIAQAEAAEETAKAKGALDAAAVKKKKKSLAFDE